MNFNTTAILILIACFLIMVVLRFPIAYSVALASIICLKYQGMSLAIVCQQMVKGISSFSLMAVPFFITMGVLMGSGGISEKLLNLADSCVGWMTGGLAMVNIVASYFFGGISGSAAADTASLGSLEIYATTAGGISVGSLFLAGYLPGAVLAGSLMVISYIISKKEGYPKGEPFSVKRFWNEFRTSIWALSSILIVVVGVVAGVFTATESAAIAVFYSLFVSLYVYRGMTWKGVWDALEQCIDTLSIVLILISTSSVFGYCLTMLHAPELASNAIMGVSDSPVVIAILLNIILLILGMIMDMAPIILISTPILLPIATSIGIDPIQYGIMLVLNCGIGLLTPPVGSVLFIGSAIAKRPMEKIVKAEMPFYLFMFIALMIITFVPAVSLCVPWIFGYGGGR